MPHRGHRSFLYETLRGGVIGNEPRVCVWAMCENDLRLFRAYYLVVVFLHVI